MPDMSPPYIYTPSQAKCRPLTTQELDHAKMRCFSVKRKAGKSTLARSISNGSKKDASFDPEYDNTCMICFESLFPARTHRRSTSSTSKVLFRQLPCTHKFHQPCIDTWLCTRDASCPLCRTTFYELKGAGSERPATYMGRAKDMLSSTGSRIKGVLPGGASIVQHAGRGSETETERKRAVGRAWEDFKARRRRLWYRPWYNRAWHCVIRDV